MTPSLPSVRETPAPPNPLDSLRIPAGDRLVALRSNFAGAQPFPHVVLDDLVDIEVARRVARREFVDVGGPTWTYHRYYSQKTFSRTALTSFAPETRELIGAFASAPFADFLASLTGIDGLRCDDDLEDGGLQATAAGGYLNVHIDPLVHPRKRRWRRRVNLLLYLSEEWTDDDGGDLELWDPGVTHCRVRIAPRFGRVVLLAAGPDTPHGFPDRLDCSPPRSRNCLALYFYVEEKAAPRPHFGRLYARPGDGVGRLGVALDNVLLHLYGRLGQTLGIDDRMVNRVMRPLRRRR